MRAQVHLRALRRLRLAERGVAGVAAVSSPSSSSSFARGSKGRNMSAFHIAGAWLLLLATYSAVRRAIDHVVISAASASAAQNPGLAD
eukprot:15047147-Alexandrium_andersonii.AAC.1